MSQTGRSRRAGVSRSQRLVATMVALGLLGLLTAAAVAKPDPRGLGTHQHFGFPPCTFRVLFGRPCPACGMTTSWTHLVRGQPLSALKCNVGGALLGMLAIVAVPWLLLSAAAGRWLGWVPNRTVVAWVGAGIVLATLVHWGVRLVTG